LAGGERDERNKNPIKDRWPELSQGRKKKRKAKERPKEAQPTRTITGRELVLVTKEAISPMALLMHANYEI
jgi:hypothetical protein